MASQQKNYNLISLISHVILIGLLLSMHSAQILVPSRSNGMEVSLVTETETTPIRPIPIKVVEQVKILTTPAEVNFKEPAKAPPPPPPPPKPVQIEPPKVMPKVITKTPKKETTSKTSNPMNDLLGAISSPTHGKSKGKTTNGTDQGTGMGDSLISNYADQVIQLVRPYVIIPDGIDQNAKAIVQVTLLPNMHVYQIKLLKSSGNSDYDNNVQQAITRGASIFPPLPQNSVWADYRVITLTFKPND